LKNRQQAGHGIVPANTLQSPIGKCTGLPVPGKREHNAEGRSRFEKDNAMSPLATALLCVGAFVVLGLIAKIVIGMWMKRQ
jgi:hypothetical protein